MPSAASLRKQLESALDARVPAALSPRLHLERELIPCGNITFDGLLQGGLAVGALTELVGVACSGRTTMGLAYAAAVTRAGGVCAWIDAADGLDPESAAANGVDLERLLWVRCGPHPQTGQQTAQPRQSGENPLKTLDEQPARHTGGGSPHPRSEGRDMPEAISAMLRADGGLNDKPVRRASRGIGTPGAPNRPLGNRSQDREEQVNSDRLPARRGDHLALAPRCAEPQPRRVMGLVSAEPMTSKPDGGGPPPHTHHKPWAAMDQALRAADLLLQGGGFSVLVLDLGSAPPEAVWRIPLATWFRFRAACERTRVSLLLLTRHPCARSSAELVVRLEAGSLQAEGNVVTGVHYSASTERTRSRQDSPIVSIRKPPQSERPARWTSVAAWVQSQ